MYPIFKYQMVHKQDVLGTSKAIFKYNLNVVSNIVGIYNFIFYTKFYVPNLFPNLYKITSFIWNLNASLYKKINLNVIVRCIQISYSRLTSLGVQISESNHRICSLPSLTGSGTQLFSRTPIFCHRKFQRSTFKFNWGSATMGREHRYHNHSLICTLLVLITDFKLGSAWDVLTGLFGTIIKCAKYCKTTALPIFTSIYHDCSKKYKCMHSGFGRYPA